MAVSILNRPLTYRDLETLPEDGRRYELIDGELVVSASPREPHQFASIKLVVAIEPHVSSRGLGNLYHAPFDVQLSEHNVVQPDLLFVRRDRLAIVAGGYVVGAPDLVVEILSPSTRDRDQGVKGQLYARFGVPEYWLVDTGARTLTIHALRDGRYEPVPRSLVLPDLVIEEAGLFSGLG